MGNQLDINSSIRVNNLINPKLNNDSKILEVISSTTIPRLWNSAKEVGPK